MDVADLHELVERLRTVLSAEDYAKLETAVDALGYLQELVADQDMTMAELRRLVVVPPGTETLQLVLRRAGLEDQGPHQAQASPAPEAPRPAAPGHGRHGAEAYAGARRIAVAHPALRPGDRCPGCTKGKVYAQREPTRLIRFVGQAPLAASVYELERLRCNLCGEVFTAAPPERVGAEKYDATAASMIGLLKYGSGVPFNRVASLQANVEIPLPASTQWEIVAETAERLQPALDELIRQAAQGAVLYNDDTHMPVLALRQQPHDVPSDPRDRTGLFTSGIIATRNHQRIALFFTGTKHAGENLAAVLARRAAELGPPIQMCDAVARNLPKPLEVILGHCLAHGRRRFVEVAPNFPDECRYVLERLAVLYRHDDVAREQGLSPEDRLRFHQVQSGPVMAELHAWLTAQFADHRVEPNSGLGRAITYLLNHWEPLTLFLRQPGAPLDNNICERALKKAILHRKNALFYKTKNGAQVGDLFMTLIHTCELCGANPFDYLTELQHHAADLASKPGEWMPWNYRETLTRASGSGNEHGPPP